MHFRAVDLGVVELPVIVVEVAPTTHRRVSRHCLPTVMPDRPRSEHRVELRLACGRRFCGVEAVTHADPVEWALRVPLDCSGRLDAKNVEDGRNQVDRMVVLVSKLAGGLDALGPGDDARV